MPKEDRPLFEITRCEQGFTLKECGSGQEMHSQVGAWTEANEVYVAQSDFEGRLKEATGAPLVIYDVGMGTAANSVAAIRKFQELRGSNETTRPLEIISLEKEPSALKLALGAAEEFPFLTDFHDSLKMLLKAGAVTLDPQINWRLLRGDFRETDLSEIASPDLIYFDFYTPASCPDLWTEEVFAKIFKKSKEKLNSLIITYSAAKSVRSAMLLAGFYVGAGSSTGLKLETTLAAVQITTLKKPLTLDWLKSLERSGKPFPVEILPDSRAEAFQRLEKHPQFS